MLNVSCRAVDCRSQQPFQDNAYLPGFVNTTIVSDQIETGWGISNYPKDVDQQLQFSGQSVGYDVGYDVGHNATCFTLPAGSESTKLPWSVLFCFHGSHPSLTHSPAAL